jgi:hypothetical protein
LLRTTKHSSSRTSIPFIWCPSSTLSFSDGNGSRPGREDFYEDLPEDKFLPIWHSEWGVDELDKLAQRYKRVGVTQTDLDGRNLTPVLNEITRKYGTLLHGVAMTKPDGNGCRELGQRRLHVLAFPFPVR